MVVPDTATAAVGTEETMNDSVDRITVHLIGKSEVLVREIDHVSLAEPQYVILSPTERVAYHHTGHDQHGTPIYEYKGTEERHIPRISGSE